VPHRIKYFRKIYEELSKRPGVVFWTGDQVIDWYKDAAGKPVQVAKPAVPT
jgi:hypothetical protein